MKRILLTVGMIILAVSLIGCDEPLAVKGISPKTGNIAGGEPVKIKGTGFSNNMGISVYIGSNKVDNVSIQGTEVLTVSTPPGNAEGPVDVRIVTDSGEEFLMSGAFTYVKETGGAMDIRALGERKSRRKKD